MLEIITTITLTGSLLGMGVILYRKIPALLELPETIEKSKRKGLALRMKKRIKGFNPFRDFSYEIFLQKILTKIRILTLKTDTKTFDWLQRLRKRAQEKKAKEKDNYWKKIKEITRKR